MNKFPFQSQKLQFDFETLKRKKNYKHVHICKNLSKLIARKRFLRSDSLADFLVQSVASAVHPSDSQPAGSSLAAATQTRVCRSDRPRLGGRECSSKWGSSAKEQQYRQRGSEQVHRQSDQRFRTQQESIPQVWLYLPVSSLFHNSTNIRKIINQLSLQSAGGGSFLCNSYLYRVGFEQNNRFNSSKSRKRCTLH